MKYLFKCDNYEIYLLIQMEKNVYASIENDQLNCKRWHSSSELNYPRLE